MRGFWLLVHVLGFTLWLGGGIATMVAGVTAKRLGTAERLAAYKIISAVQRMLVAPGAGLARRHDGRGVPGGARRGGDQRAHGRQAGAARAGAGRPDARGVSAAAQATDSRRVDRRRTGARRDVRGDPRPLVISCAARR